MADLAGLIEQAVTGLGYELVDYETSPRARLLRVFIDRPAQADVSAGTEAKSVGVTIEDCATVSHQLSRLFLVENIDYDRLEVSSPGLDRPLKKPADYERFIGHELQLKLRIPEGGGTQGASSHNTQGASSPQRNFSGVILGLVEGRLRLKTGEVEREFALDNIDKARLVPKF
ncbi:MAG: ribosome maturation factor RimP [Rhodocyclaceae bacterium]|jgi:ribosome maturation factor RimP|nr:ribosome maturation factor RimP [Rhodocyclaceae bacterium]MDP3037873.1 ribosome maturation factor RimP [Rhodocyclaceae bacterium]